MKNLTSVLLLFCLLSSTTASFAEIFFPLKVGGTMIMIPIYGEGEETPESKMTPLGTDEDRDGVRDDVQYKILSTFGTNSAVTNYTMGMARGYQRVLSGNLTNKEINEEVATIKELDACISDTTSDPEAGSAFLLPAQLNTVARTRAYLKAAADAYDAEGPPAIRECRNSIQKRSGSSKSKQSNAQPMPKINPPNLEDYGVYFINGVMNSDKSAEDGAGKLEDILSAEPIHLLYNEDQAIGQFFDLYVQKTGEVEVDRTGTVLFWQIVLGTSLLPDNVRDSLYEWLDPYRDIGHWAEKDLKRMIENAKTALSEDKKVIIVAHSEGNFFYRKIWQALNAWDSEKTKQCFAGVGLATPLSSKEGNYKYITSSNDKVMNTVRWWWKTTLSANVTVPSGHGDYLGHGLQETYLSHHAPVERLQSEFKAAIKKLDESCQTYRPKALYKVFETNSDNPVDYFNYSYSLNNVPIGTPIRIAFEYDFYKHTFKVKAKGKLIASSNPNDDAEITGGGLEWWRDGGYWDFDYDPKVYGNKLDVRIERGADASWSEIFGNTLCIDYKYAKGGFCDNKILPSSGERYHKYEFLDSDYWSCTNYKINGKPVSKTGSMDHNAFASYYFSADCACTMSSSGSDLNKCSPSYGSPLLDNHMYMDCDYQSLETDNRETYVKRCNLADKTGIYNNEDYN